jgi:hypothetical protein
MIRRFHFDDTPEGRQRFRFAFEALLTRGTPKADQRQSKEDHRSEARILRALKAISDPHPDAPPPTDGQPDLRMRVLKSGGGTLELQQPDYKRLQDYVQETQWATPLIDLVVDFEDQFDAAEKVDEKAGG